MHFHRYQFPSRRSNIMARQGLVVTSQPLAAQVGLKVLQDGGNAVDAAIATAAALCVVEPGSTGIGGDAFALIWWAADETLYGLNASGPAPAALTVDLIRDRGHRHMPSRGALTVTVPGSVRGWQAALDRFGKLGLDSLLTGAIHYSVEGFPVSEIIADGWGRQADLLAEHPDTSRVWLPSGKGPRPGDLFQNLELASTLKTLATSGPDPFYSGEIGRQIVSCVGEAGGVLTMEDLDTYQAEWVTPIAVHAGEGFAFHEIPPNGQGLAALLALGIVDGFDLDPSVYGTADYWHLLIEAMKLGFGDALAHIGDPRRVDVPVDGLLSNHYTRDRRALISPALAGEPIAGQPLGHGDTVYLAVADTQGNMVSWIQSLYMGFGSGLTAGTTGVSLHNRGANFTLQDGHPNQVAPGKRPYHTIIPGFITKGGQAWSAFGVMGGFMQPQGHLQVGMNLTFAGMDPQAALDAPRFNWLGGRRVALEPLAGTGVYQDLARRGHDLLSPDEAVGVNYGGGQVIIRDPDTGVLFGGSDPRKDGAAVGF